MGKAPIQDVGNLKTIEELSRFCFINFQTIANQINGGITFADNILVQPVEASFTSGVQLAIKHSLKRVPKGYIVVLQDASASIYTGTTVWTSEVVYLVASSTVNASLVVF